MFTRHAFACGLLCSALATAASAQAPFFTTSFTDNAENWNSIFAQGFSAFVDPTPDPGIGLLDTVSLDRFEFFKSGNDDITDTFRLAIVDNYFLNLDTLTTSSPELVALSTNAISGTASIAIGAPIAFSFDSAELTFAADYAAVYVTEGPGGALDPVLVPSLIADFEETFEGSGFFLPVSDYGDPDLDFQYSASNFINSNEFGSFFAAFSPAADARFVASFNLPSLGGDFNDDASVTAADYAAWRDVAGEAVSLPNEVSTPGQGTIEDYNDWAASFGVAAAVAPAATVVPEPSAAILLCFGCVGRFRSKRLS